MRQFLLVSEANLEKLSATEGRKAARVGADSLATRSEKLSATEAAKRPSGRQGSVPSFFFTFRHDKLRPLPGPIESAA